MNVVRILILLAVVASTVGYTWIRPFAHLLTFESGAPALGQLRDRANDPESAAWALLAEASEFCSPPPEAPVAHPAELAGSPSRVGLEPAAKALTVAARRPTARRDVAEEAIAIVRDLAPRIGSADSRAVLIAAVQRLERSCGDPDDPARAGSVLSSSPAPGLRSLDGSTGSDRHVLIAPYLNRLSEAPGRSHGESALDRAGVAAVAPVGGKGESGAAITESVAILDAVGAGHRSSLAEVSAASQSSGLSGGNERAEGLGQPEPLEQARPHRDFWGISDEGGSRRYRDRVRRWAPVFEREARRLRVGRGVLQVEIDTHTIARSRAACRAFGEALERFDPMAAAAAPSRGLTLRIERMLGSYRRGASECAAGRPATAFAFLSEGDREWRAIAGRAASIRHPRPLRVRGAFAARAAFGR